MKTFAALFAIAAIACAASSVRASGGDRVLAVDVAHSKMTVYVYKQGLFAFAADNHEVSAPIIAGALDDTAHSVSITVDAAKMQVLDPGAPADRRAKVQAKMLSDAVLDVGKYPRIEFRSSSIKS